MDSMIRVNDHLCYRVLPIASLRKADWNYKKDDDALRKKLAENIRRNGQVENIIVRQVEGGYEIINGNHRYDALTDIGASEVVVADVSPLSLEAAMRLAIETNETRFENDPLRLSDLVRTLSQKYAIEQLATTMPFDVGTLSNMAKLDQFSFQTFDRQGGGGAAGGAGEGAPEGGGLVHIILNSDTYESWLEWKRRCAAILGYDNDAKALELAIIEALNTPIQSQE